MSRAAIHNASFIALVLAVTLAFVWLLLPYYSAILWAVILAILFNPLQRRLTVWLGGRRSIAAVLSVLAAICVVVIPVSLVVASLSVEVSSLYRSVRDSEFTLADALTQAQAMLPSFARDLLNDVDLGNLGELQQSLMSGLSSVAQGVATGAFGVGQGALHFLVILAIMLYLLFFLFRDGRSLATMIRNAVPLDRERTDDIAAKFVSVVKATVRGNVLIAIIQGGLGGITFWLLGLDAPLLWGFVMAVLSLLPAVGAILVWAPFAIYLGLSGEMTKAVILLLVGALVISMIDNLLRPLLVGRETRLPDYVVLISTIGGLSLFGINGFVLGPLVAALFIAVWSQFTDDRLATSEN
ncbi:MAG: AI-2E family transporter [Candidatus Devosia phytovorans]|uniref:AI-2E family transporter n=1 Tax=Candidatus Devosia phytovorans TaxID=3121372 RepID=A0AAJ5VSQ5_9HYPH|nr:AI-2E family transporter [Devosia sp.]WEK03445.1 MAG: AI-2E family transporter [Devosia sp.]